jgi:protein tyrosine/serine phosphatase
MLRLIVLLLLVPAILAAQPGRNTAESGNIPRFSLVAAGLYRGGQPDVQGFQFLKEKGVRTIINLRAEDNSEEKTVERLGMNYIQIGVEDIRPWTQIPPAAIAKYFEIINNPANYPVFFHCRRGADRTGTMAAFYRMGVQGWDAKKAYFEARDAGMRWFYAGLKSQIYGFQPPARRTELQTGIKGQ